MKPYRTWNVTVHQTYNLDRKTHRRLIEPFSSTNHLKNMLVCRFVKFSQTVLESSKPTVRFLANLNCLDKRTVFGQNLHEIMKICDISSLNELGVPAVKKYVRYSDDLGVDDLWKIELGRELMQARVKNTIPGFSKDELEDMLKYICIT